MGPVQFSWQSESPKIRLLNRDFGNILSIFPRKNSKTQSSLNFLQSGPRKLTKSDFSGVAPIRRVPIKAGPQNTQYKHRAIWQVSLLGLSVLQTLSVEHLNEWAFPTSRLAAPWREPCEALPELQEIPCDTLKNKIDTPPPPPKKKPKIPPPPLKRGILWTWVFPAERTHFSRRP